MEIPALKEAAAKFKEKQAAEGGEGGEQGEEKERFHVGGSQYTTTEAPEGEEHIVVKEDPQGILDTVD
ncbi:hypothetical protein AB0E96_10350 [Kitasatospora sp. NPDC036755]|uniref:hypothetical protein n=1 Tax=Kitasatospora sp. NPDC036755 TaxID=3154600 RepID=UPI0033E9BD6D